MFCIQLCAGTVFRNETFYDLQHALRISRGNRCIEVPHRAMESIFLDRRPVNCMETAADVGGEPFPRANIFLMQFFLRLEDR